MSLPHARCACNGGTVPDWTAGNRKGPWWGLRHRKKEKVRQPTGTRALAVLIAAIRVPLPSSGRGRGRTASGDCADSPGRVSDSGQGVASHQRSPDGHRDLRQLRVRLKQRLPWPSNGRGRSRMPLGDPTASTGGSSATGEALPFAEDLPVATSATEMCDHHVGGSNRGFLGPPTAGEEAKCAPVIGRANNSCQNGPR